MEDRWIFENGIYRKATEEEIAEIESGPEYIPPPTRDEQAITLMRSMAKTSTTISDELALVIPDILPTWEELLADNKQVDENVCLTYQGQCYRVRQPVTPQSHQPPGSEGMLAIYVPIDQKHAGTKEDPIPWVYGMICNKGSYFTYKGKLYYCNDTMNPCVWEPGGGAPQWDLVE